MKSRMLLFFTILIIIYPISAATSAATEDPVSVFNKSRYDTRRVFQLVAEGEERVASLEGKDVVVVLGTKGAGKSTTINHLIGAKIVKKKEGKKTFIDVDRDLTENVAEIGHEGYCTVIPALYSSPTSPYSFLDTRGFDATDRSPEELIAASILTEIAIKKASSVRLMVVSNYSNLIVDRGESFTGLGRTLGKIVVGHEVPALFVFNRFSISTMEEMQEFLMKSAIEKNQEIMDSLYREIDAVLAIEHNGVMKVGKSVAERLRKGWRDVKDFFIGSSSENTIDEEIMRDARFQEELSKISYTNFLKYNRDRRRVTYVDPLAGESSRNNIFLALSELEPVGQGSLVFTGYNTERVEFNRIFALQIEPLIYLLESKLRKDRFSVDLLTTLRNEAEACANHHANVHGRLANILSEEELNFIRESYAISDQEIESRRNRIESHTKQLLLRKTRAQDVIKEILEREPVLYWTDRWRQEAGFFAGWWRNYKSTYPSPTNFVRWNDALEEGTLRNGIERSDTPYLIVNYTSQLGYNCEGSLNVYVRAQDEPGSANEIRRLKTDIRTIDAAITENERLITGLRTNARTNLQDKVADKRDFFADQKNQIESALALHQRIEKLYYKLDHEDGRNKLYYMLDYEDRSKNLYYTVDESGNKQETEIAKEIALSARIGEKLNAGMKAAQDLKRYYDQLPIQPTSLRDDQIDEMFSVPLLDPTLLRCKPTSGHGSHDTTYERSAIAQYMNGTGHGTCPVCRQAPEALIPLPSQLTEVVDSIAADVVWLNEKLQAFEQARSRL